MQLLQRTGVHLLVAHPPVVEVFAILDVVTNPEVAEPEPRIVAWVK